MAGTSLAETSKRSSPIASLASLAEWRVTVSRDSTRDRSVAIVIDKQSVGEIFYSSWLDGFDNASTVLGFAFFEFVTFVAVDGGCC